MLKRGGELAVGDAAKDLPKALGGNAGTVACELQ